jgi:hypothetical protein
MATRAGRMWKMVLAVAAPAVACAQTVDPGGRSDGVSSNDGSVDRGGVWCRASGGALPPGSPHEHFDTQCAPGEVCGAASPTLPGFRCCVRGSECFP